jgi:chromosome segregation ATPase
MLTDAELTEIEQRLRAATPAPWTIGFNGAMRSAWAIVRAGSSQTILHLEPTKNIDLDESSHRVDADLDLVQYAPADIQRLLDEVRELRAQTGEITTEDSVLTGDLQETQVALMQLAEKNERLQSALEFYADLANYRPPKPMPGETPPLWIGTDLGRRAREALGLPEVSPETPAG